MARNSRQAPSQEILHREFNLPAIATEFAARRSGVFYPVQYEGEEQSPNIFYTGATPNQQLIPAAEFMMKPEGGSKKKFYLLGTDYVFPRTANKILKAYLLSVGVPESNIEEYTPFGHADYQTIASEIDLAL